MKKYLSYSELRLWNKDKQAYHRRYVEGIEDPQTPAMRLGSIVHKTVEDNRYNWLKELTELGYTGKKIAPIRKLLTKVELKKTDGEAEATLRAKTPSGIQLFCVLDRFNKKTRELDEYKTTSQKDGPLYGWSQKKVDYDDQISFYAYAYYLNCFSYFSEIRLHRMNVVDGTMKTFYTVRSRRDIVDIADKVEVAVAEIKAAGLWERRLSRQDSLTKNQVKIKL